MDPAEWRHVLETLPPSLMQLRPGASEESLVTAESHLGRTLPTSYRSFLSVTDGGRIGDVLILGTPELSTLPLGILPSHLIPFHPVSAEGDFECFDSTREDRGEPPVIWYQPKNERWEQTYVDFTDWLLDQLIDLKFS